jgi:hypothetical protein
MTHLFMLIKSFRFTAYREKKKKKKKKKGHCLVLVGSWEDRSGDVSQLGSSFCIKGPVWFTEITYFGCSQNSLLKLATMTCHTLQPPQEKEFYNNIG